MDQQIVEFLKKIPASAVKTFERAFARQGGRANAIKAHCLDCTGVLRDEVRNCPNVLCPLHAWRPFQIKTKTDNDAWDDLDREMAAMDALDEDDEDVSVDPYDDDEL